MERDSTIFVVNEHFFKYYFIDIIFKLSVFSSHLMIVILKKNIYIYNSNNDNGGIFGVIYC